MALITRDQNTLLFLTDTVYQTFYTGTVSGRDEKVLVTSDDGIVYGFNQSNGELLWGWMPRSLVQKLKTILPFKAAAS